MLRGGAAGALQSIERAYLWAAPLPALLALIVPSILGMTHPGDRSQVPWSLRLTAAGGILSAVLVILGIVLLVRRSRRQEQRDPRLTMGLIVAALPALLIGLVALLYLL